MQYVVEEYNVSVSVDWVVGAVQRSILACGMAVGVACMRLPPSIVTPLLC